MTKDETEPVESKNHMQTAQNFVKCSHLKFISFLCPQNWSGLFVGRTSSFIICHPTSFSLFCLFASVQVHERKGQLKLPCSLTRQGKNRECHPAHLF